MPTVEDYAALSNPELDDLIARRLGFEAHESPRGGCVLVNADGGIIYRDRTIAACWEHIPKWSSDANLAFDLFALSYLDLYHRPNGEWQGLAGYLKYSSMDLCRVLCVLWLAERDIPVRRPPSNLEAF